MIFYAMIQIVITNQYRTAAVTNGDLETIQFPAFRRRCVEARFDGGTVISNG